MAMASSKSDGLDSVISVLELIKEPMISVPQNYVQIDQQNPAFPVCSDHPLPTLPTIDFKLLVSVDTSDSELEKLHSSCKEWGFFQLVNHGVSSSLMNQLLLEILSASNSLKSFSPKQKPIHQSCSSPEATSFPRAAAIIQRLAMKLLGFIAEALKVDLQEIEEMFDDGFQSVRMTNYPPCPQPELAIGFRPHSDGAGITILNQVNGVDGLQIKKDGVWIPMKFIPDALVVNVGDILEILSNGVYKSVEHRVTTNPEKERISVAFFVCPKLEAEVGPVTSLISPQNPPLFRRTGMEKYCKDFFSRKLHAKSFLETMKIESTWTVDDIFYTC